MTCKVLTHFYVFYLQISNLFGTAADFETRLGLILQCTQYLIQNNKDEALIKEFNYQILLKTREANEKVS